MASRRYNGLMPDIHLNACPLLIERDIEIILKKMGLPAFTRPNLKVPRTTPRPDSLFTVRMAFSTACGSCTQLENPAGANHGRQSIPINLQWNSFSCERFRAIDKFSFHAVGDLIDSLFYFGIQQRAIDFRKNLVFPFLHRSIEPQG